MDGRELAHGDLVKIVDLASIVLTGEETGLPAVAARDDVLRHIGDVGPAAQVHSQSARLDAQCIHGGNGERPDTARRWTSATAPDRARPEFVSIDGNRCGDAPEGRNANPESTGGHANLHRSIGNSDWRGKADLSDHREFDANPAIAGGGIHANPDHRMRRAVIENEGRCPRRSQIFTDRVRIRQQGIGGILAA